MVKCRDCCLYGVDENLVKWLKGLLKLVRQNLICVVHIWFLIFLLCRGVCDCWLIFNFLAVCDNFTLRLSVVKNINGVCKFFAIVFYSVLLFTLCVWNLCLFASEKTVFAYYERGFSKHKIHTWLYKSIKLTSVGY